MIRLEKCPICGGEAKFNTTDTYYNGKKQVGFHYHIECSECDIMLASVGEVTVTLEENGTLRYVTDDRLELASKWNTRQEKQETEEVKGNE